VIESRRYFLEQWEDGVAQRVRAERHDALSWVRVLEAVCWWPTHEGKEWPCKVIVVPGHDAGVDPEPDAWTHFENQLGMDDRYRWEPAEND
jgi:hypothetical protein